MAEGGPILLKENDVQLPDSPTQKPELKTSEEKAIEAIKHTSKYVKLNIGGFLYYTTLDTLTKQDNMLRAMFSGRLDVKTDGDGWVLIDRDGRHFGTMLNYLRDGSVPLPETKKDTQELLAEAKYYLIDGLRQQLETHLQDLDEQLPICRVPVITTIEEEQKILSKSNKPMIKLLYNRANNKYSYTNTSDDNLLKNIELFDKLSVKFSGRVRFVKDICGTGRGEICYWMFYGSGKKVTEVCCESIVYATERKQTKIEFPEARILEETLNIMLYEMRCEEEEKAKAARLRGIGTRTPEAVLSEDEL